jgi:prophage regulatory protein
MKRSSVTTSLDALTTLAEVTGSMEVTPVRRLSTVTSSYLKRPDVVKLVGLCYTTIYNMEKAGKFPARRRLSPGRVAWLRSEVEEWLRALPAV